MDGIAPGRFGGGDDLVLVEIGGRAACRQRTRVIGDFDVQGIGIVGGINRNGANIQVRGGACDRPFAVVGVGRDGTAGAEGAD